MELKYVVPNMAQTFGNLEFAGENNVNQQRLNGRFMPVSRSYGLHCFVYGYECMRIVHRNGRNGQRSEPDRVCRCWCGVSHASIYKPLII